MFHLLNMDDFVKPFRDGSVGKDQSCSGERKKKREILVSMICNRRRILCFSSFCFFLNSFFPTLFFYLPTNAENRQKKSELTQEEKLSRDLMSVHLYRCSVFFSLGMS